VQRDRTQNYPHLIPGMCSTSRCSSLLLLTTLSVSHSTAEIGNFHLAERLGLEASLYQILQILSLTLFEKTPILQALQPSDCESDLYGADNQLILFDF
jgi:hypothetical protein